MDGLPVTIRTYDLGADKNTDGEPQRIATNPALGLRAIRLCLIEPERFLIQLRALLRASHYGKVNILIPMLASSRELDQTLALIAQAKQSLDDDGVPYDREVKVGGMIEVPAAALALGHLHAQARFPVDRHQRPDPVHARGRSHRRRRRAPLRPAAPGGADAARARVQGPPRKPAGAGRVVRRDGRRPFADARCCSGSGLRHYSMHSAHLLDVKQRILQSSLAQVKPLAQRMLRESDPDKLRTLLDRLNA